MQTPDLHELARQVRRVADRQELTELIARYGNAVDDRDFDAIARMFTEDGEFHDVRGHANVVRYFRERTAAYTNTYHYAHTLVFEFESDDVATGVVNGHAEICVDGKAVLLALRYLDRYQRGPQGWQFRSRLLKFRYVLPLDELASRLADPMRVRYPGAQPQPADLPDKLPTYIASRAANTPKAAPLTPL